MLYDQLAFHKIYYHKFQLTGGIVWQLGALLRNLVVIWMHFTTCDTSLLNRSRPVLLMKYCHKKTTKSHSQYNLYPLKFNWTWLVFSILFVVDLWQSFKLKNVTCMCGSNLSLFYFVISMQTCFVLHTWWCMIKQRKIKKLLNWTAKHPNQVTFHL